ncbi:hypothetical protein QMO14_10505 [Variovorax sp. CAN2819]|uniref:hypothetical protein n=1 Tax=Variovorax sp. CAN15 TaxID=3046727 RepID=UPI0026474E15|nr:hypothetical protein [Variovorax sp. CAN15]MDN6884024.1 hypothetical protein [Variovorax sp. CAN15]
MKLSHLALTVIEDPDHSDQYHWLLLEATGHEVDQLREFAASEEGYATAQAAFDAGALRWRAAMSNEDEDADPVGDGGIELE